MSSERSNQPTSTLAKRAAAQWVLRHDRGLTAAEQDAFSQWLAADISNRNAWAEQRWAWDELDRLAGLQASHHALPDPDLLKHRKLRRHLRVPSLSFSISIAAMAALAVGIHFWEAAPVASEARPAVAVTTAPISLIERRELPDGSILELNRGAVVNERFSEGERRVTLKRGEVHFTVAKDAARPFVVEANGVLVRAVGTAFDVRLESSAIDVLVTEGQVAVRADDASQTPEAGRQMTDDGRQSANIRPTPSVLQHSFSGFVVSAGEKAVVPIASVAAQLQVHPVTPSELEARLAWRPQLLDFTNAPLPEIVAEFNRRNPVRLVLGDPRLAAFRLSAKFRSDNAEGFVRLMISDFGLRAERRGEGEILLMPAR